VRSLAFSRDGAYLASGDDDRTVSLWGARTGLPLNTWKLLEGPVKAVAFDVDGRHLAAAAGSLTRVWDVRNAREPMSMRHEKPVSALAFTRGGELVTLSG